MHKAACSALFVALLCTVAGARAQDSIITGKPTAEQAARCATIPNPIVRDNCLKIYSIAGLTFPEKAETTRAASLRMGIFKPEGSGPFPAVILLHSCASLSDSDNMAYWATEFLKAGYVAFIVDSWEQRGVPGGICAPTPRLPLNAAFLRMRDAFDALEHLVKFDFVDKGRIAAVGSSQGGRVIYRLSSAVAHKVYAPSGARFAALVALYGECFDRKSKISYVPNDVKTPVLALLGELDEDGDPRECVPRFERAKSAGAPIEWHVFPSVGHVWDVPRFSQRQYTSYHGAPSGKVLFEYDAAATAQSRTRIFAFFEARMGSK